MHHGAISIHAPRTGSDGIVASYRALGFEFQSTLPARGATSSSGYRPAERRFQSTLPARGATNLLNAIKPDTLISIHAPRTGSDCSLPCSTHRSLISIHAPRTGSDYRQLKTIYKQRRFQSTLPARGATPSIATLCRSPLCISIHAPRTGSDSGSTSSPVAT